MKKILRTIKSLPKPNRNRRVFIAYLVVVALFAIPIVAYTMRPENPADVAQAEIDSITKRVSMLMDIPSETPTIATISDASKLRSQQFFAKAQNDDKVLIFNTAQKAILYRPSTNKIIEVALYKPPVANTETPVGDVAGAAVSIAPTPLPTQRPFSLQDLIGDNNPSPSIAPTQPVFQPTQPAAVSPTPAL